MTWFRVDDSLGFHHKVVGVGNAAMGLWVRAGAWCAQQNNGGVVPGHMVKALGGTMQHAKALVAFGLWDDEANGTYVFHDWLLYQPSPAEVKASRLAKSEARAKAGRAGGIASGVARRANREADDLQEGSTDEATHEANAKQNEAPSLPVPSLPFVSQPAVASTKRAKPKTGPPDDMLITPEMAAWGQEHAPLVRDPKAETVRFLDHARANGKTFLDWSAAWRTWMTNAQKFAERDGVKPVLTDSTREYLQQW